MKNISLLLISGLILTSCGETDVTKSRFGQPFDSFPSVSLENSDGLVVAFADKTITDSSFSVRSDFYDHHIGNAPEAGIVTMDVDYEVTGYKSISNAGSEGSYYYLPFTSDGNMDTTFNFGTGEFHGTNGILFMSGDIEGNSLSGNVVYLGVDGVLDGAVDATQTVGAFHGNDSSTTYAGAFVGDAD